MISTTTMIEFYRTDHCCFPFLDIHVSHFIALIGDIRFFFPSVRLPPNFFEMAHSFCAFALWMPMATEYC